MNPGDRVRCATKRSIVAPVVYRYGTIVKPHFAGWYVRLDKRPAEKREKVELVDFKDCQLIEEASP